jgi:hypothetical protein
MSTPLDRLFDSISTESDLDAMVKEQREEDLHLEFKQKADRRDANLAVGDRRAFSEAVSGFANADGGVLIFGIRTKKVQGADRAAKLEPITDHHRLRSKFIDSILTATQPVVDGVRIECIDPEKEAGAGYVKCFIPQSLKPPHRAMAADQHYFRRGSSSTLRMEHYELEDVFGRRLRPVLKLSLQLHRLSGDLEPYDRLHFFLVNEGRQLARHVGFLCKPAGADIGNVHGDGLLDATDANNGTPAVQYYHAHNVIHANGITLVVGWARLRRNDRTKPLSVDAIWYAEDMETRSTRVQLAPGQLLLLP